MAEHVIRLPDVGEGVAEAELVEWHVKVGDLVREDTPLGAVMTDKATVEIPSPVEGEIVWLGAEVGDVIRGRLRAGPSEGRGRRTDRSATGEAQNVSAAKAPTAKEARCVRSATPRMATLELAPGGDSTAKCHHRQAGPARAATVRPWSSASRRRKAARPRRRFACARERRASTCVRCPAPGRPAASRTRIWMRSSPTAQILREWPTLQAKTAVKDVKVVGLRRKIAEKMALASARIPHITYVEEIDVTALEELRATLNQQKRQDQPRLTLLPFLMRAMVRAIAEQPNLNALFDDEAGVIHQHAGVHIGIAAQTPAGLMVPVVQARRGARSVGLRGRGRPACRSRAGPEPPRARS